MQSFLIKPKIYFGESSLAALKQLPGTRALVVSDKVMERLGYLETVVSYLHTAGMQTAVFTDVVPDPDVKVVAQGMELYQQQPSDVVVALGGGSVIDTAKAIIYSLLQFSRVSGTAFQKPLFVAIPSTSGTGSEVTDFAVITSQGEKLCLVDTDMAPDLAILDAACLEHVPAVVIADTGIDALVHAIEAYVSTQATPCTDALAEKAVELVFKYLRLLYSDASNLEARQAIQNAACLAGMAFTNAGLGINHSLAHALGGTFHLPHGRANALLLPAVLTYNANLQGQGAERSVAKRYAKLAAVLALPARTAREGTINFMQATTELLRALNITGGIKGLKIEAAEFTAQVEAMAKLALDDRCTKTTPRQPELADLMDIYHKAY